ncbi:MAG: glycosyltransferase [Tissierellales bacterium]|jgi:glycosyltransferase involved in cell wall biosynthesis|nr:glycosyltransferase [Tissierellales bacterium]
MENLKKFILKRQALLFPFLDVSLNVINYLIHIFLSWYLFSEDYGVLSALLAFLAILMVFGISFQIYVADKVATKNYESEKLQSTIKLGEKISLLALITLVIAGIWIKNLLRSDYIAIIIVGLIFAFNLMTSIERGVMQGKKKFLHLNMSFYIEVTIRLMLTYIGMKVYRHYNMALIAILCGMIFSFLYGRRFLKEGSIKKDYYRRNLYKDEIGKIAKIFIANFYLYYFTSLGMIIVNYYLVSLSGIYGITTKISQLSIKIGFSLITVILPFISREKDNTEIFRRIVKKFILMFLILSVIGLILVYYFTPWFVVVVFSNEYSSAVDYVFKDAIANVILMNAYFLLVVEMVLDHKKYLNDLLITGLILTLGMLIKHENINEIIVVQGVAYLYLFIALIIKFLKKEDVMGNSKERIVLFLSWRDIKAPKKGGAEVFTHEMLKRTSIDGVKFVHFSPLFEGAKPKEEIDNVLYIRKGGPFSVIYHAHKYYKKNRENIEFVVDQANTHRFFTPFWVNREKRIFFIHQFTREIWFRHMKFPMSYIGYYLENWMTKIYRKNYTMTVSESTKDDLLRLGFKNNLIKILPEGIDFKPWAKEEFKEKEKNPTFIYVGRFAAYKGINDAIEAFGKLKATRKDMKFWVVGKKKEKYVSEELKPIMNKYQLTFGDEEEGADVIFWGFVTDEKKLELMSRAHALVFPSLREGWGLTVTEAAAVGTPSIVYDSPGLRDAVNRGKAGYITSINTSEEIKRIMEFSIENRETYVKRRSESYDFASKFNWDNTAREFENMIRFVREEGDRETNKISSRNNEHVQ